MGKQRIQKSHLWLASLFLCLSLSACTFQQEADEKFGDQHFKTAIALIELHQLRVGEYPETLNDIEFTGDWDQLALSSVSYERIDSGYSLDITRGWAGKPTLAYPDEFWQGLGLVESNAKTP